MIDGQDRNAELRNVFDALSKLEELCTIVKDMVRSTGCPCRRCKEIDEFLNLCNQGVRLVKSKLNLDESRMKAMESKYEALYTQPLSTSN